MNKGMNGHLEWPTCCWEKLRNEMFRRRRGGIWLQFCDENGKKSLLNIHMCIYPKIKAQFRRWGKYGKVYLKGGAESWACWGQGRKFLDHFNACSDWEPFRLSETAQTDRVELFCADVKLALEGATTLQMPEGVDSPEVFV